MRGRGLKNGVRHLFRRKRCLTPFFALLLAGCDGVQSTFTTFGAEAEELRALSIVMFASAAAIVLGVLALATFAVRDDAGIDHPGGMRLVLWLGGIGPTLLLSALLVAALPQMRPREASAGSLTIAVDAEQFWWRVVYRRDGAEPVETANEIRVPVGRPVTFALESPDVIHSFWIPGLAGKVDVIPGRTNELVALATRAGRFRGACAEFCGLSHALMAFDVVAMEAAAFDAWLDEIAAPAANVSARGRELFDEHGCAGCHVVRGHFPGTPIGPDLTHYGARTTLAAGTLPMSLDATSRFIREPRAVKPGARMPSFREMAREDADAIAEYLIGLE